MNVSSFTFGSGCGVIREPLRAGMPEQDLAPRGGRREEKEKKVDARAKSRSGKYPYDQMFLHKWRFVILCACTDSGGYVFVLTVVGERIEFKGTSESEVLDKYDQWDEKQSKQDG